MFIETTATARSLSQRKAVLGVGINDSIYNVQLTIDGKLYICPLYNRWLNMLRRCYSENYQKTKPTYRGCSVCIEWLTFSAFSLWMSNQDWKGNCLDKDIIKSGNKIYSPEMCAFVSQEVNNAFSDKKKREGLSSGVTICKRNKKYESQFYSEKGKKFLGYFDTDKQAGDAYAKEKANHLIELALTQSYEKIKIGLIDHAKGLCIARGISL